MSTYVSADILLQNGLALLRSLEDLMHQIAPLSSGAKRFTLIKYLNGRKGKSAVIKANDSRLGIVALKFVATPNETKQRSFNREVAISARVAHPNIVATINSCPFASDDKTLMVAILEFVNGDSIDQLLLQESFTENDVVQLTINMLHALRHCHFKGVIHKDVKCSNILYDKNTQLYRLLDFGISAIDVSAKATVSDTMVTATGEHKAPVGTPLYMSLEQHLGKDINFRTDIYSLGVAMFRCLTRHYPHGDETSNQPEIFAAILTSQPILSIENVSNGLSSVIAKALQKEANDRYQTATEMLNDLLLLLDNDPIRDLDSKLYIVLSYRTAPNKQPPLRVLKAKLGLEALGHIVFWGLDVDMMGPDWRNQWITKCNQADVCINFLSARYVQSQACVDEWNHAMKKNKEKTFNVALGGRTCRDNIGNLPLRGPGSVAQKGGARIKTHFTSDGQALSVYDADDIVANIIRSCSLFS